MMTRDSNRPDRALDVGALALLLGLSMAAFGKTVADPDLWGHLRFGADFLDAGSIPRVDPYSYLPAAAPWTNHEWLAEVVFAALYRAGGPPLLVAFKMAIGLVIVLGGYARLRRSGVPPLGGLVLGVALVGALTPGMATIRPQLFTYLGFFAVVSLLAEASRTGRLAWLAPIPFIVGLWVNFHGGVLAGLGMLGFWGVGTAFEQIRRQGGWGRIGWLAVVGGMSGLALLANPYGMELPVFLLRTATVARPEIMEWRPLQVVGPLGPVYVLIVLLAGAAWAKGRGGASAGAWLAGAVAVALPLTAVRHLPLAAIAVVVLLAPAFAAMAAASRTDWGPATPQARRAAAAWLVLAGMALLPLSLARAGRIAVEPATAAYPVRAIEVVRRLDAPANLALPFNWGEYAIWQLGPRVRVSMDGRRETVYPDSHYRPHLDFEAGRKDWATVVDNPATDLVLVPEGSALANLMGLHPGWRPAYRDKMAVLFAREGTSLALAAVQIEAPDLPADGRGLSFPRRFGDLWDAPASEIQVAATFNRD